MGNGIWEMNLGNLLQAMGPLKYPLAICSFFALTIIIEKIISLAKIQTNVAELQEEIFSLLKNNKIKEAIQLCDKNPHPLAKILRAGLVKFGSPREEIKGSIEDASSFEIPRLEIRLNALATIAHVSPLLGLLGTVTGMVNAFNTIQARAASLTPVTPGDLAGGMAEALFTTAAGLVIAIPCYVAYNYFVSYINNLISEMSRGGTRLINFMSQITETPPDSV